MKDNREIGYLWVPLVVDKTQVAIIRNALYEHKIKYSLNAYIGSFVLENCIIFSSGHVYQNGYLSSRYKLTELLDIIPALITDPEYIEKNRKPRYFLSNHQLVD